MATERRYSISCDAHGCPAYMGGASQHLARRTARGAGWKLANGRDRRDLCPMHAPLTAPAAP